MKIDSAIKEFTEKYDKDAMESIERLGNDYTLNITEQKIKLFDIKESFDMFRNYLRDYASYMSGNASNPLPKDSIMESVKRFIDSQLFKESQMLYKEVPVFVESYITGIDELNKEIYETKASMSEAGVDAENVGLINEFCDVFVDRLNESFDTTMNSILWASGYNSRKRLQAVIKGENKKETHVFL